MGNQIILKTGMVKPVECLHYFEPYKTSDMFDSTARSLEWLG